MRIPPRQQIVQLAHPVPLPQTEAAHRAQIDSVHDAPSRILFGRDEQLAAFRLLQAQRIYILPHSYRPGDTPWHQCLAEQLLIVVIALHARLRRAGVVRVGYIQTDAIGVPVEAFANAVQTLVASDIALVEPGWSLLRLTMPQRLRTIESQHGLLATD